MLWCWASGVGGVTLWCLVNDVMWCWWVIWCSGVRMSGVNDMTLWCWVSGARWCSGVRISGVNDVMWCWVSDVMLWCWVSAEWDAAVLGQWCECCDTVVLGGWHDGVLLDEQFPILQWKAVPSSQGVQQSKKNDLDYLTLENESDTVFQSGTTHSTMQCHIWEELYLPHLNYFFKKSDFFNYGKNKYAGWLQLSGTVWVGIFQFLDNLSVPTWLPSTQVTIFIRYMNAALFGTG